MTGVEESLMAGSGEVGMEAGKLERRKSYVLGKHTPRNVIP